MGGRLPERTNGAASKAVVAFGLPRVRIPHLPLGGDCAIDCKVVAQFPTFRCGIHGGLKAADSWPFAVRLTSGRISRRSQNVDQVALEIDDFSRRVAGGFQSWLEFNSPSDTAVRPTDIEGVSVNPTTNQLDFSQVTSIGEEIAVRRDVVTLAEQAAENTPDIEDDQRPALQRALERAFRDAVATCVVVMGTGVIIQEIRQAVTAGGTSDFIDENRELRGLNLPNDVTLDEITNTGTIRRPFQQNRHVCEFIPIYLPGTRTAGSNRPIGQATLHIGEAQGLYEFPGWNDPWGGDNSGSVNSGWHFITTRPSQSRAWKNALGCVGNNVDRTQCDEFPWAASVQGGGQADPRPHLRIIDAEHNNLAGVEWGNLKKNSGAIACGTGDYAAVIVVPHPLTSLISVAPDQFVADVATFADIRSESIC